MKREEAFTLINKERVRLDKLYGIRRRLEHEVFWESMTSTVRDLGLMVAHMDDGAIKIALIRVAAFAVYWLEHFQE